MMSRLLPAAALVFAAGIAFWYVGPTYSDTIVGIRASIEQEQSALDAAAAFKEKENQLASDKKAISADALAHLEVLLPSSVDNVGVILDLTSLAMRTGLELGSINVVSAGIGSPDATSLSAVGSVDLTLSASGTYQVFRTFLTAIERSVRILDITSLTVSGSDTGVYNYTMSVRLYWLR